MDYFEELLPFKNYLTDLSSHFMSLPTPKKLKRELALSPAQRQFIQTSRQTAKDVFLRNDKRLLIAVGPCSIHDRLSTLDYAKRLKTLSEKVSESCFLVMRVFMEKPRTITGWKGFLYDPHLDGRSDIKTGIYWTRQLLLDLAELKVPIATEFVDPLTASFFDDLITWVFIGARTSASQPHRQLASHLQMPVGFKNSVDGNIDQAIHAVIAARSSHAYLHIDQEGKIDSIESKGNLFTHIVLRGSAEAPNFEPENIRLALEKLQQHRLPLHLMIDCGHGNCQKQYLKQKEVFRSVLDQIEMGNDHILGMMLESHLHSGHQLLSESPSSLKYGVSITDPCIDWSSTEELLLLADSTLSSGDIVFSKVTSSSPGYSFTSSSNSI